MISADFNFQDTTSAAIVAGRLFEGTHTSEAWEKLCGAVDRLAARVGLPLGVVIGTDLSSGYVSGEDDGEPVIATAVVGLVVASTSGPERCAVDTTLLLSAVERAAAAPWKEIAKLLGPKANLEDEIQLWGAPTGPLAGFHVCFGVLARDESQLLEYTEGSPQRAEPSLDFIAGKDMDQRRIADGVWGVPVAYNGDWCMSDLKLTPSAHEDNQILMGKLTEKSGYYLMASFD